MNKIKRFGRDRLNGHNRFIYYITGPSYLDIFDLLSVHSICLNKNGIMRQIN